MLSGQILSKSLLPLEIFPASEICVPGELLAYLFLLFVSHCDVGPLPPADAKGGSGSNSQVVNFHKWPVRRQLMVMGEIGPGYDCP